MYCKLSQEWEEWMATPHCSDWQQTWMHAFAGLCVNDKIDHSHQYVWTINKLHLPYKTGLDVMQSHPLHRMCFSQYQASSAALGWQGGEDCMVETHRLVPCVWSIAYACIATAAAPANSLVHCQPVWSPAPEQTYMLWNNWLLAHPRMMQHLPWVFTLGMLQRRALLRSPD